MDAPPAQEDCRPFIHVSELFGAAGVTVPRVLEQDLAQGFLLLTDLGHQTYLSRLHPPMRASSMATPRPRWFASRPRPVRRAAGLRPRPAAARTRPVPEWYVARHLGVTPSTAQQADLREVMDTLLANNPRSRRSTCTATTIRAT